MLWSGRGILVFLMPLALAACALSENATADEADSKQTDDRIVTSELSVPVAGMTAYDLINNHKPHWLQKSGHDSIQNEPKIQVYVNNPGSSAGSISALKRISALTVEAVEYFDAREAQFRFGIGNSAGAILVHTKNGS